MAPQQPTARGIRIRNAHDAHLLFYAVHLKRLPMIHSRLDPTERSEVRSGSVFIWEERSNSSVAGYGAPPGDIGSSGNVRGIERWTDGLKWGPSRVRDDFLFYQEKDPSDRSSALTPPPTVPGTNTYRPIVPRANDLLIKQTYSVHYRPEVLDGLHPQDPPRKWHLTAYHSHGTIDSLADVTSIPELDGLQVPPELFRKARVGKRKEGTSLPPLPSQNPTHAQLAGTPTPYSPPSSVFSPPPPASWNPSPSFDPQTGHPMASGSDLSQRNRRGRPPSRSVEGNSPPFVNVPYPRGTEAIEAARMRHATSHGQLRDGRGDGGWVGSNESGYGQNGRGNYGPYPGSNGSDAFSPTDSTMSGLSLPSPVSASGGNVLANGYGASSTNGGYGGDQSRQFQSVRSYSQCTSTPSQNTFNQDRPTGQQHYSLTPVIWNPSTPQPGSQGHTPPNQSPQIPQQQPNMLPRLQPVPPMASSSYPTQSHPHHYSWHGSQQTQQQRPQLAPFGQQTSNPYTPAPGDTSLRIGGHNSMSPVHRQPTWGGGSSYSSYPTYDAPHGQTVFGLEAAKARDKEDEKALLQLSRTTAREDINVKTEDLNSGMPMGGTFDAT